MHNSGSKAYSNNGIQHEILKDINLSIEEGEFVSIIGYSGTGKSTLINFLSGLVKPDSGSVKVDGKIVLEPDPERAIIFQNYSLLPWLTVYENIALAVNSVFPQLTPKESREEIEKYIAMVKLSHASTRYPHELSGGMRQRVAVARALSMKPKVLLLDELLSALDALTRATLQDEISEIRSTYNTTVLWITNDPDEAILLADRVIPLLPSQPATLGESIKIDIPRPRNRTTLNSNPQFKKLRSHLVNTLLESKALNKEDSVIEYILPDILPEDLNRINTDKAFEQKGPRRRGSITQPLT
jgi:nitrate/nitrite transport system ATP-binding protein